MQPPPCGCVLKQRLSDDEIIISGAAASVRLCVETNIDLVKMTSCLGSRLRAAVC